MTARARRSTARSRSLSRRAAMPWSRREGVGESIAIERNSSNAARALSPHRTGFVYHSMTPARFSCLTTPLMLKIRPATHADYTAIAAVLLDADPDYAETAEALK